MVKNDIGYDLRDDDLSLDAGMRGVEPYPCHRPSILITLGVDKCMSSEMMN